MEVLGQNMDTVSYDVGTPPTVTSFSATNNTAGPNIGTTVFDLGDSINISWTVVDTEGLKDNPISLCYTTDGTTWLPIVLNTGPVSPGTSYSDTYTLFNAPVSTFFKLKIVATDLANNNNVETTSPALNSGDWATYAGTNSDGVGGAYNSVQLKKSPFGIHSGQIAVNPINNDTYFMSFNEGIVRSNSITGKTEYFILSSTSTMPSTITIDSSTRVGSSSASMRFDQAGNLYLKDGTYLYRINVDTLSVKKLFGGGSNYTSPYTASDIGVLPQAPFDIDLNKNLYFYVDCLAPGGIWSTNTNNTAKIVKATYNSGTDDYSFADLAGNCVLETPATGGTTSLSQGLGAFRYKHLMGLSVNGDGTMLYYGQAPKGLLKNNLMY
jgi:hypothetical protein